MGFFFWKNNGIIDDFARNMADEFCSKVQPDLAKQYFADEALSKKKKKAHKEKEQRGQVTRLLDENISKLRTFRESNKIGVYGKARFHMQFKERLEELGYSDDLAEEINQLLLLRTP